MRTIIVHLRKATEQQVEQFLTRTYPFQKGPPWICDIRGDACLYIKIYRDLNIESHAEEIALLHTHLGGEPTVSVIADVSGRHPGDEQIRDFVYRLLSEFEGLAQDEYTDGFWTLDDITLGRKRTSPLSSEKQGYGFFDYHLGEKKH